MNAWDKITLYKFQQIDLINSSDKSDIDKTLFSVCAVFDFTEFELDNMKPTRAAKFIDKVNRIFKTDFTTRAYRKIGRYKINYDPSTLTFGQYIELSFFLQAKPIQNAHYVLASLASAEASTHRKRADYFLRQSITKIVGSITLFIERFKSFNDEYKVLFGLDPDVAGKDAQADKFNRRYGWIYAASQVAEYERITNEQAFGLPIRQAFNDLAYLKAKASYDAEQLKKK